MPQYSRLGCVVALVVFSPLALLCSADAQKNAKVAVDAAAHLPSEMVSVIVQYQNDPDQTQDDKISALGGLAHKHIHSIHATHAHLPAAMLNQLASDPNVKYISVTIHSQRVRSL